MAPTPPNKSKETEDSAKVLWGKKWFWPILQDLDKFEQTMDDCEPVDDALSDDAPIWMFRAVWNCGTAMTTYNGIAKPEKLDSRNVGAMVGAHWSICDAGAKSYPIWQALSLEQIRAIDAALYPGFCRDCTKSSRKYFEQWTPQFLEIKRNAAALAASQGSFEEIDYLQGYLKGQQFMNKIREKIKPTKLKRIKDEQARNCVQMFAVCCGREIETNKANLSWPELHQAFGDFVEDRDKIDEDTFKRVCYDFGLKGVGKAGRRPSNEIGTPRNSRRP